jgi:hypothetical protein
MNAESNAPIRLRERSGLLLDALNFFLADVRGALGPYLNVFLVTQQGWSQSSVGVMTTVGGLIGLVAQTPAGTVIDATPPSAASSFSLSWYWRSDRSSSLRSPPFGPC